MSEIKYVKYCPLCGMENPSTQAFCMLCHDGDLSVVPVEPRRASAPKVVESAAEQCASETRRVAPQAHCVLELIDDPNLRFTVYEGETVGRTEKADVVLAGVPKQEWISSIHAKLFRRGEQWYAQHLGQTNFIKVDGEMYKGREEVALQEGSILVLSLTPFRVTFGGK